LVYLLEYMKMHGPGNIKFVGTEVTYLCYVLATSVCLLFFIRLWQTLYMPISGFPQTVLAAANKYMQMWDQQNYDFMLQGST
jgi:hypothetical protein